MVLEIPFRKDFHDKIRRGEKTMTTRTKRYGEPGDLLKVPGSFPVIWILLLKVRKTTVWHVARDHYREEGCRNTQEFLKIWRDIHPRKPYNPDEEVYLHEFHLA